AAGGAAQVAMQDETWRDGAGRGAMRVLEGAGKGAAVGAVSAGVSEGLERGMASVKSAGLKRAGKFLGPDGRDMLKEGVSESLGSMAGEGAGLLVDASLGKHQGGLGAALKQIGEAGLRDMVTGAGRSGARSRNRKRYNRLMARARGRADITNADLRVLQRAGISAGVMNYGDGLSRVRAEVEVGRAALAALPESLRTHAEGFDQGTLLQTRALLASGELGSADKRAAFVEGLRERHPDLDAEAFERELGAADSESRAAEARARKDVERMEMVRNTLVRGIDEPLRRFMSDVPMEGLDRLPEADLRRAAELVAGGETDPIAMNALLQAAKAKDPDLDESVFLGNLEKAVTTARQAREAELAIRARRRRDVLEVVPESARALFAGLPDKEIGRVEKLLDQESGGEPGLRESLYRAARRGAPDLERDRFMGILDAAVARARARGAARRLDRRRKRQKRMLNMPEDLRGPLSVLPDDGLVELRVLLHMGAPLTPAVRNRLLEAAGRETPDVDPRALSDALDETMARARPERLVSGGEEARLQSELMYAIPPGQRRHQRRYLEETLIMKVRDDDFEAFTGSEKGDAVTIIIHGRPVVMMREGADPSVLREEGIHVLQARDPEWRQRIEALNEHKQADWDRLPLEEQIALYRIKVEVEIDAQQRLLASLETRRPRTPGDVAAVRRQVDLARTSLDNLQRRQTEMQRENEVQKLTIRAGQKSRADWFDQAARLFSNRAK
ncbi:MAG: hypothetical protein GY856_48465, partial [bacterium]|nr:hypothetical protein [bacterium]